MHVALWHIGVSVPVFVFCRRRRSSSRRCSSRSRRLQSGRCRWNRTRLGRVLLGPFHRNQTLDNIRPMRLALTIILKLGAVALARRALGRAIKIEPVVVFVPLVEVFGCVNGKVLVAFASSPGTCSLGIATRDAVYDVVGDHVAQIEGISGIVRVTVVVFNLGAAVTSPQQLTINIEQVLRRATSTSHDEMSMSGHAVAAIAMIMVHNQLGVGLVLRIVGDVVVETNASEQLLVR